MKKTYQVDSRKPSALPKIGSVAVAIGSLSLAATSIAPSVLAVVSLPSSNPTQESAPLQGGPVPAGEAIVSTGVSPTGKLNVDSAVLGPVQIQDSNPGELPAASQPSDQIVVAIDSPAAPLTPASSGNISSATPTAGAAPAPASSPSGNLSSATPAGGTYAGDQDDDDDNERDDHDERDEDDD